jgi:hypothetical protein
MLWVMLTLCYQVLCKPYEFGAKVYLPFSFVLTNVLVKDLLLFQDKGPDW